MTSPRQQGITDSAPQRLTYAELMWNKLHLAGWWLKHTAATSQDGLGVRHFLHATKNEHTIELSAPTFTSAVMQVMSLAAALENSAGLWMPDHNTLPILNRPARPADYPTESAIY